jgi:hypothetical protein
MIELSIGCLALLLLARLAALAEVAANEQYSLEMDDLPRLVELVARARAVPAREVVDGETAACADFQKSLAEMGVRLRTRVERTGM